MIMAKNDSLVLQITQRLKNKHEKVLGFPGGST